jgi:hypothetical protein
MADTLVLGGIAFDGFSTPSRMGAGGKQAMVIHKLPGGQRVIDTLGPDDENISWDGEFFGNDAFANALALDGMRAAGQVVSLTFAGQFRSVIIDTFSYHIRRLPVWVEYQISCMVYQNPSMGGLGGSLGSIDTLVLSDLATASGLLS